MKKRVFSKVLSLALGTVLTVASIGSSAVFADELSDDYEYVEEMEENYTDDEEELPGEQTLDLAGEGSGDASEEPVMKPLISRLVFVDGDNADGIRPGSVIMNLYKNGNLENSAEVFGGNIVPHESGEPSPMDSGSIDTSSENGQAIAANAAEYGHLYGSEGETGVFFGYYPTEENAEPVRYSFDINPVEGYEIKKVYDQAYGYNLPGAFFVAVHTPAPDFSISASAVWNDDENAYGTRPDSLTVYAKSLEEYGEKEITLSEGNSWEGSVTFPGAGKGTYGIEVPELEGYENSVSDPYVEEDTVNYQITLTRIPDPEPERISISGSVEWIDEGNKDGIRPGTVTLVLSGNGESFEKTVSADDAWAFRFNDLLKYDAGGEEIVYTLTENGIEGYTTEIRGFQVLNTHEAEKDPETITISGAVSWDDENNKDGIRPSSVNVVLSGNGESFEKTVSADNAWAFEFAGLLKYDANGNEISYSLNEAAIDGYTSSINGYQILNTHESKKEPETISIKGAVFWNDKNNKDGMRPASVTVRIEGNGEKASAVATESNSWSYTFEGLRKYDANGKEISYAVSEDPVTGYTTSVNGYQITNTHEVKEAPETTSISGSITWDDVNDKDRIRPDSVTVYLNGNGQTYSKSVTKKGSWKYKFEGLAKYDSNGKAITYTINEESISGYTHTVVGYNIVNTHKVTEEVIEKNSEMVSINGRKVWDDMNNADNLRPASITVRLYANGAEVSSTSVTAANGWAFTFQNVRKYNTDGSLISYTVDEDPVNGYTKTVNGFTIVNTHLASSQNQNRYNTTASETLTISGSKTWVDNNNEEKIRPSYIVVHLYADGKEVRVTTVTENNGWMYSFANMPKRNEKGSEIIYTIDEDAVTGYTKTVNGYNLTNTRTKLIGTLDKDGKVITADSKQKEDKVQTGDSSPVLPLILVLAIAAGLIAGAGYYFLRKKRSGK